LGREKKEGSKERIRENYNNLCLMGREHWRKKGEQSFFNLLKERGGGELVNNPTFVGGKIRHETKGKKKEKRTFSIAQG